MEKSPDLSKIIGLIMENPDVIERIKKLAGAIGERTPEEKEEATTETLSALDEDFEQASAPQITEHTEKQNRSSYDKRRRCDLLCAIKPYVSQNRSKAIDTMLSVMEVIDVIKER